MNSRHSIRVRRVFPALLVAAALFATGGPAVAQAGAASPAPVTAAVTPTIEVTPTTVAAGQSVQVTGTTRPNARIDLLVNTESLNSITVQSTNSDAEGRYSFSFRIIESVGVRSLQVVDDGDRSDPADYSTTIAITVVAPSPPPVSGPAAPPTPDEPGIKRLAGTDRYSTAAAIVVDSFPSGPVPVAFIATGEAYADALAGGPAADAMGGPVLPVARAGIPAPILGELDRLNPARIVILGGPGAVSDAIASQLQGYTTGAVTRLAGANRYATAAAVATSGAFTAPAPQVLIATGLGFADALAGGSVGAATNSPVLLVNPNSLPPETAIALRALQPRNIAVLGGTNAVSEAVLQQLRGYTTGGVNRLSGPDRYSTAARLAQIFWPSTADVVYLATGRNFPDALAGVPAAGLDRAPLLLIEPACMPAATRQELDRLRPSTVVVLGGPATVSEAAVARASCEPAPRAVDPEHGGVYAAVYLAVSSDFDDPVFVKSVASARAVGYDAYTNGTLGCDVGAAEGLGLDPATEYYTSVLYFSSWPQALQFAALHPPAEVGIVQVLTICLD